MSAEAIANKQCDDTKAVAKEGARFLARLVQEIKNGLDPNKALADIMNNSSEKLDLKISEMEKQGLLTDKEASSIRETIKSLSSAKDLEDGCNKAASMDQITEKLDNFKMGDSKEDLMKGIKDCVKAPDSIRMQTRGSKDFEVLKANIQIRSKQHGTLLNKETLNLAHFQHKREHLQALRKGTKVAAKTAVKGGKLLAKGSATVALGACTWGIGAIVAVVKEILTAAWRAFSKTTGLSKAAGLSNKGIDLSRGAGARAR